MAAEVLTDDPVEPGIAQRLREATAVQHDRAETRGFITRLMGGELSLEDYTRYLGQYAWIYEALESRVPQLGDPAFMNDRRLFRVEAIHADMEALDGADWRERHPMLPDTALYVEHLRALAVGEAPRYLAHHYTRYLGDLSGGQAIAALVARHYGASPAQLNFYDFTDIDSPVRFKRKYRDELDALNFSEEQILELIDEAQKSFVFNSALFDALGEDLA